jgi:adenine-specific DNA-methyltransferase
LEHCRFVGAEILKDYYDIAFTRLTEADVGTIKIREDVPVAEPNPNSSVAKLPDEFARVRGELNV